MATGELAAQPTHPPAPTVPAPGGGARSPGAAGALAGRGRTAAAAVGVAIAYYLGTRVGLALTFRPNPVSALWPPNAILLSALLLVPRSAWGVLLLAMLPAHLLAELPAGVPTPMALCWYVSNTGEALLGAVLVLHLAGVPVRLDSFRQLTALVVGTTVASVLSSFVDAGFVVLNGWGRDSYWRVWRMRSFSNVLAGLTIVPAIVSWARSGLAALRGARVGRWLEAALLTLALLAVCTLAFSPPDASRATLPAVLYTPIPLLLWAAVRFGPGGTGACVLVVAVFAVWGAIHGRGPFSMRSPEENALSVQLFLILTSLPLVSLAVVTRERRRAEAALLESQRAAALAAAAGRVSIWGIDLHTGAVQSDAVLATMLGLDPAASGEDGWWTEAIHPADRARVAANDAAAFGPGAPRDEQGDTPIAEIEYRVVHRDGSTRWLLTRGTVLRRADGTPYRLVRTGIDITSRKRIELEAQEQRRELTRLGRVSLLGVLSGALAHELSQPLAAIHANAAAARRLLAREPVDLAELREIVLDIIHDDERAAAVIHELRRLLEKGESRVQPLDVNALVRDVISIAHADFLDRGVVVTTSLARELPLVSGDRVQFQQVILNLMLNACEAMNDAPAHARGLIVATEPAEGGGVHLAVRDSGSGIAPEALRRLFEPFFTTKPHGLGLGLAICRSIVSQHAGRLWAENNVTGGATFHLLLPGAGATPARDRGSVTSSG